MQNLHPLFVHFPVALLIAAAAAEWVHLATRRPAADSLSAWLLYLGAVGALAAALTGWIAAETVAPVAAAHVDFDRHRALGFVTAGVAAALAAWRIAVARRGGPRPRALFAIAMLGLVGALVAGALAGGELVYEHGEGTRLTAPGGPLAEPARGDSAAPARDVPRNADFR